MPKLNLRTARRIKVVSGEALHLKGRGFEWSLWTPAALFQNGEQGAWFDPGDRSTLFQDASGTAPVTEVGQPVGLMLDKSGNGNHASQETTTARPTLQADSGGKPCLVFDGVDDFLTFGPVTSPEMFSGMAMHLRVFKYQVPLGPIGWYWLGISGGARLRAYAPGNVSRSFDNDYLETPGVLMSQVTESTLQVFSGSQAGTAVDVEGVPSFSTLGSDILNATARYPALLTFWGGVITAAAVSSENRGSLIDFYASRIGGEFA